MSGLCAIVTSAPETGAVAGIFSRMAPWRHRRRTGSRVQLAENSRRGSSLDIAAHELDSSRGMLLAGDGAMLVGDGLLLAGDGAPIAAVNRAFWLAFDGEIYNRQELCQQLGSDYSTRATDSELVLAAYEQWGVDCVCRINGAWAFLILDLERGKLVGSRDRLGTRPLYCGEKAGSLIFADHPQAVALGLSRSPEVDCDELSQFLRGLPPQSLGPTFYQNVRTVPPACVFEMTLHGVRRELRFRTFWHLDAEAPKTHRHGSFIDAQQEFLDLLSDSIRLRSIRTDGLGCFLSGGLDSSLVSRLLVERLGATDLPTYSLVYADPQLTDWPRIQAILRQGGLRSNTTMPTAETLWASAEEVIQIQGAPLLGVDVIAHWQLLQLVAESGCRVVLDGAGADEILGATQMQQSALIWDRLRELQVMTLAREVHAVAKRESWKAALGSHLLGPCRTRWRLRRGWNRYDWLSGTKERVDPRTAPAAPRLSAVQQALQRQVCEQVPTVLAQTGQNASAAGVRIRRPYLDHRLVEYCFRLPSEYRTQIGVRKRILREAAKRYLPPALFAGKSRPFIDSQHWMSMLRQHSDALLEMAQSQLMAQLPIINAPRMRRFVSGYLSAKHDDGLGVWRLYTSWRWLQSLQ
jgi:asparagine synthase (glutamine-hydrolysing)